MKYPFYCISLGIFLSFFLVSFLTADELHEDSMRPILLERLAEEMRPFFSPPKPWMIIFPDETFHSTNSSAQTDMTLQNSWLILTSIHLSTTPPVPTSIAPCFMVVHSFFIRQESFEGYKTQLSPNHTPIPLNRENSLLLHGIRLLREKMPLPRRP